MVYPLGQSFPMKKMQTLGLPQMIHQMMHHGCVGSIHFAQVVWDRFNLFILCPKYATWLAVRGMDIHESKFLAISKKNAGHGGVGSFPFRDIGSPILVAWPRCLVMFGLETKVKFRCHPILIILTMYVAWSKMWYVLILAISKTMLFLQHHGGNLSDMIIRMIVNVILVKMVSTMVDNHYEKYYSWHIHDNQLRGRKVDP